MFPYWEIGIFKIPMFTLMIFIGIIFYILITIFICEKKEKLRQKDTNILLIISIPAFLILTVFAFIMNSIFHSIEEKKIILGGITWLGGVVFVFPSLYLLLHFFHPSAKGRELYYISLVIPGLLIAHAFGRLGCFFGGCCYGAVTDSIFGVVFPKGSMAAIQYPAGDGTSLPLYPTQVFESIFDFALFVTILCFYKRLHKYLFEIYALSYSVFRFLIEFLRGDERGSSATMLSPSQLMCIILLIYAALSLLYKKELIFKRHLEMDKKYIKNYLYSINVDEKIAELDKIKRDFRNNKIDVSEYEERLNLIANSIKFNENIE